MPTIGAAVTEATKQKFEFYAIARKLTPSRLAASIIQEFLDREGARASTESNVELQTPSDTLAPRGSRNHQVYVRMDQFHYMELGRLAAERNWYRGTYLANLFHAHTQRRPVLCEAEINAVRQVARQLADTSRSLNTLTRMLKASQESSNLVDSIKLEEIRELAESEASAVGALLRANLREWGVSDGQERDS